MKKNCMMLQKTETNMCISNQQAKEDVRIEPISDSTNEADTLHS